MDSLLKENYYEYVSDAVFEPYRAFRETVPKLISPEGIPYFELGKGPVLLCLPGSTGKALTFYPYFEALGEAYRILAIDYPEATGVEALTLKLMQFLRTKQLDEVYILANSFGTILAQSLMTKMPNVIKGVVLTHGVTKTSEVPGKICRQHRRALKGFVNSIRFVNFDRFQKKFAKQIRRNVDICQDDTSKRLFWEGIFVEMLYDTTKAEMLSNYGFMKEFWDRYIFDKKQFEAFGGPVVLIESEDDHEKKLPEKIALRALFQNADYRVLPGTGNLSLVKNANPITNAVLELIDPPH